MAEELLNFQIHLKGEFPHPSSSLVQLPTDPSPRRPGCMEHVHEGGDSVISAQGTAKVNILTGTLEIDGSQIT